MPEIYAIGYLLLALVFYNDMNLMIKIISHEVALLA
ncbi:hypothetical protein YERSI8AC_310179 [Enterobacterales bacterium 8AC]|nr:hypothetical protein YERSI8AC_310179 [Enterobacterales bacterium 8AC]